MMAPWINLAGWTLLHFVWQGTAIAVATAIGFRFLRAAGPAVRYGLASAAMVTMLIAPAATAARLSSSAPVVADLRLSTSLIPLVLSSGATPREEATRTASRIQPARSAPDAILGAIVLLWLAGVLLLQLRLIGGWWRVRALHRASLTAAPSAWQKRVDDLATLLRVRQLVRVVDAHAVDIPSVIGWWRPVILLPIAALSGLTAAQADAILVHELAHIRRHDYFVNGLQHVAETLLFYHPAVWWLSRRMRIEREHCCDAVVVQVCGDPIEYAVALAELEAGRSSRTALAVAATDGSLVQRIRVMLMPQPSHRRPLADALVTAFVVAALMIVAGGYRWRVRASVDAAPRAQQATPGLESVVVTVNGEAVTDVDLSRRQTAFKRDRPDAPLAEILIAAVDERLVEQRGRQLGYALSDDQFRSILRNIMATNGLATDAALQDALRDEQLTLADLRRNLESQMIASRLRLSMPAAPVTDAEARDYFSAHVDDFPLQTFELARPRIEELLADARRGPAFERFVQTLRSSAVLVWQRSDLQQAYEARRAQDPPQGRVVVPQQTPAAPRTPGWQVHATEHFDMWFTPDVSTELPRVERHAERAYQRISSDLKHDLADRLNLVLFATDAERDRAGDGGPVPGSGSRILLALDRPDDRFQADVVHEVTHEFEFDILPAGARTGPEWILEGLAEHEGEVWVAGDVDLLRGLVLGDRVPALSAFESTTERRLRYAVGHAAFDFIKARWGMDGIRQMLFAMRQRQAADRAGLYLSAFSITAEAFDQAFEHYLRERFPFESQRQ